MIAKTYSTPAVVSTGDVSAQTLGQFSKVNVADIPSTPLLPYRTF